MDQAKKEMLEHLPFYGKTAEALRDLNGNDPSWKQIVKAMREKTEQGDNALVLGFATAYFDETGLVKTVNETTEPGPAKSPVVSLEQYTIRKCKETADFYECISTVYDENGNPDTASERIERAYCIFDPGNYAVISFRYTDKQDIEKRRLYQAMERNYEELEKIDNAIATADESGEKADLLVPFFYITFIPMIYGGRYSMVASEPIYWQEWKEENTGFNVITIFFRKDDVTFLADPEADPDKIYETSRNELLSEWLRQEQIRKKAQEDAQYQANLQAEKDKILESSKIKQHTFASSKTAGHYGTTKEIQERKEVD